MSEPNNPLLFDWQVTQEGGDGPVAYSTQVTLRDLFAAFAMAGINAAGPDAKDYEQAAIDAYVDADAMLAEREKTSD